ncbi:flagellar protein export ATPase FliI [Peptococcaceae bacterium 1198_IL3148]
MALTIDLNPIRQRLQHVQPIKLQGQVTQVVGLTVEVQGINACIGEVCSIIVPGEQQPIFAEVVGFKGRNSLLMPLGELRGVYPGCSVLPTGQALKVKVGEHLLGQVLDGLGRPIEDELGDDIGISFAVDNQPPNPLKRKRISSVLPTGVRAIDALLTCGCGQRIGIFAGSGVGKSTLLGMIAKHCSADVNVIGLIGERGREVLDFIESDLGPEGLAKSIVVAATSDQPALVRLKGAYVATAIAEYFRDQGKDVMLLMDSVTRFAMAQREVGLAIGEPPATRGYTPSVFALLPKLLERSGMGQTGSITAFYTVLVDGDDMNEPIADAVRGILDGHIVLSRKLAASNHYPAIDVLSSVSRVMPDIVENQHISSAGKTRGLMATYSESEDLINIGAYVSGSNPKIDLAIRKHDQITEFLTQRPEEYSEYSETLENLYRITEGS